MVKQFRKSDRTDWYVFQNSTQHQVQKQPAQPSDQAESMIGDNNDLESFTDRDRAMERVRKKREIPRSLDLTEPQSAIVPGSTAKAPG